MVHSIVKVHSVSASPGRSSSEASNCDMRAVCGQGSFELCQLRLHCAQWHAPPWANLAQVNEGMYVSITVGAGSSACEPLQVLLHQQGKLQSKRSKELDRHQ